MRAAATKNPANQRPRDSKVFSLPVSGCRPSMSETRTSLGQAMGQRVTLSAGTGSQQGANSLCYRKSPPAGDRPAPQINPGGGPAPLHEIALLTSGMIGSPSRGPPVQAPRSTHRLASRRLGAIVVTVPVPVVAVGAQEEHLTASLAGHEP
jgi:hypothetical protein